MNWERTAVFLIIFGLGLWIGFAIGFSPPHELEFGSAGVVKMFDDSGDKICDAVDGNMWSGYGLHHCDFKVS